MEHNKTKNPGLPKGLLRIVLLFLDSFSIVSPRNGCHLTQFIDNEVIKRYNVIKLKNATLHL
ncbi:hypothetical protein BGP_5635 [Beggiatoa sp. PS]|nr:hypothetical protein BGP_5635 [Beggiatoa sp. PS]